MSVILAKKVKTEKSKFVPGTQLSKIGQRQLIFQLPHGIISHYYHVLGHGCAPLAADPHDVHVVTMKKKRAVLFWDYKKLSQGPNVAKYPSHCLKSLSDQLCHAGRIVSKHFIHNSDL